MSSSHGAGRAVGWPALPRRPPAAYRRHCPVLEFASPSQLVGTVNAAFVGIFNAGPCCGAREDAVDHHTVALPPSAPACVPRQCGSRRPHSAYVRAPAPTRDGAIHRLSRDPSGRPWGGRGAELTGHREQLPAGGEGQTGEDGLGQASSEVALQVVLLERRGSQNPERWYAGNGSPSVRRAVSNWLASGPVWGRRAVIAHVRPLPDLVPSVRVSGTSRCRCPHRHGTGAHAHPRPSGTRSSSVPAIARPSRPSSRGERRSLGSCSVAGHIRQSQRRLRGRVGQLSRPYPETPCVLSTVLSTMALAPASMPDSAGVAASW